LIDDWDLEKKTATDELKLESLIAEEILSKDWDLKNTTKTNTETSKTCGENVSCSTNQEMTDSLSNVHEEPHDALTLKTFGNQIVECSNFVLAILAVPPKEIESQKKRKSLSSLRETLETLETLERLRSEI
jgi:hypothetical protein